MHTIPYGEFSALRSEVEKVYKTLHLVLRILGGLAGIGNKQLTEEFLKELVNESDELKIEILLPVCLDKAKCVNIEEKRTDHENEIQLDTETLQDDRLQIPIDDSENDPQEILDVDPFAVTVKTCLEEEIQRTVPSEIKVEPKDGLLVSSASGGQEIESQRNPVVIETECFCHSDESQSTRNLHDIRHSDIRKESVDNSSNLEKSVLNDELTIASLCSQNRGFRVRSLGTSSAQFIVPNDVPAILPDDPTEGDVSLLTSSMNVDRVEDEGNMNSEMMSNPEAQYEVFTVEDSSSECEPEVVHVMKDSGVVVVVPNTRPSNMAKPLENHTRPTHGKGKEKRTPETTVPRYTTESTSVPQVMKQTETPSTTISKVSPANRMKKRKLNQSVNTTTCCRCWDNTTASRNVTCKGLTCSCYMERKPCLQCNCHGCQNPYTSYGKKEERWWRKGRLDVLKSYLPVRRQKLDISQSTPEMSPQLTTSYKPKEIPKVRLKMKDRPRERNREHDESAEDDDDKYPTEDDSQDEDEEVSEQKVPLKRKTCSRVLKKGFDESKYVYKRLQDGNERWKADIPQGALPIQIKDNEGYCRQSIIIPDKKIPQGWTKHTMRRKHVSKWDVILVNSEGRKFRSRNELRNYFAELKQPFPQECFDFQVGRKLEMIETQQKLRDSLSHLDVKTYSKGVGSQKV